MQHSLHLAFASAVTGEGQSLLRPEEHRLVSVAFSLSPCVYLSFLLFSVKNRVSGEYSAKWKETVWSRALSSRV